MYASADPDAAKRIHEYARRDELNPSLELVRRQHFGDDALPPALCKRSAIRVQQVSR
jgi:hypothetical protein